MKELIRTTFTIAFWSTLLIFVGALVVANFKSEPTSQTDSERPRPTEAATPHRLIEPRVPHVDRGDITT